MDAWGRQKGSVIVSSATRNDEAVRLLRFEALEPRQVLSVNPGALTFVLDPGATDGATVTVTAPAGLGTGTSPVSVSLVAAGDGASLAQSISTPGSRIVDGVTGGHVTFDVGIAVPDGAQPGDLFTLQLNARGVVSETTEVTSGFVDLVVVIDESGSMSGEQNFIGTFVQSLETALVAGGFGDTDAALPANRYGLVGYGGAGSGELGRSLNVGGDLMGSADEFAAATSGLVTTGSVEDGYSAVDFVLQNYQFREGSSRIVVLVTDEDRDNRNSLLTSETFVTDLAANGVTLVSIVDANLTDENGQTALAIDFEGNAYRADSQGGVTVTAGGAATSNQGATFNDYIDPSFRLSGFVADLNELRTGADLVVASFAEAIRQGVLNSVSVQSFDLGTVTVVVNVGVVAPPPEATPTAPLPPGGLPTQNDNPSPVDPTTTEVILLLTQDESPTPTPPRFGVEGGSDAVSLTESQAAAAMQSALDQLPFSDRSFDQTLSEIAADVAQHSGSLQRDASLLMLIAETDVPDTLVYAEGDETARRERPPVVPTGVLVSLPELEPPVLVRGQEQTAESSGFPWWLAAATAVAPVMLWGAGRQILPRLVQR